MCRNPLRISSPNVPDYGAAVMCALTAILTQLHSLQQKLLATGDAILVEASPHDRPWGDAPDGQGENRPGYPLTAQLEELPTDVVRGRNSG